MSIVFGLSRVMASASFFFMNCLIPPKKTGLYKQTYKGEVSIAELCKQGAMSFVHFKKLLCSYLDLSCDVFLTKQELEKRLLKAEKSFSLLFLEERSDLDHFVASNTYFLKCREHFLFFSELDWQNIYPKWKKEERKVLVLACDFKQAFSAALYFRKQGLINFFALRP